jgi:hypothetical protein
MGTLVADPAPALLGDTFTIAPGSRPAGSALIGQKSEIGGALWDGTGRLVLTPDGAVTSEDVSAAMGILPLPHYEGGLDLSADLDPQGSGFAALAFLPGPSSGDFWNTTVLWTFVMANGDYQVRADGEKTILKQGHGGDYAFKPGSPVHVEMICDPGAATASVKLNGTSVVANAPVGVMKPITHVAFRFNQDVVPGQPKVKNFMVTSAPAALHLKSVSALQFYVNPDQTAVLDWSYSPQAEGSIHDMVVRDYSGAEIAHLKPTVPVAGKVEVSVNLPQGFYTLNFTDTNQEFGLVVLPAFSGRADPFFGMDMALTELVPFQDRDDYIAIIKRGGISTGRERLAWGLIQPAPDSWGWDVGQQSEATRQLYQKHGVGVLDLFSGAPGWMEKNWNSFPQNLVGTEKAWETIGQRFQPEWSAVEVWNEPDTPGSGGNSSADQYLPIVKAIHYAFQKNNIKTLIGDGVFAYSNKSYLDLAARNGLLEQANFLSFHYYGEADDLQNYILEYRTFLNRHGVENMPLWITEMGPPWIGQPGTRPAVDADSARGLKFARNAVEARACGIARIFPFILVDYHEQDVRNFGLLDSTKTPLRPLATYLEAVQMLSNATYIGDLKGAPGSRVFQRDASTAVVVYTASGGAAPAFPVQEMRGIDGRLVKAPADGLTYLTVKMTDLEPLLERHSAAMKINHMAAATNQKLAVASPIIIMPSVEDASAAKSVRGYQLAEGATQISLHVRVVDLGADAAATTVTVSSVAPRGGTGVPLATKSLAVPPAGEAAFDTQIPVSSLQLDSSGAGIVQISAPDGVAPAAVSFSVSRGLKEQLASTAYQFALPIGDLNRWKENSAGHGTFSKTPDGGWAYDIAFGSGDKWAYPRFTPPQEVDLKRVTAVLIRARCSQSAEVRVMTFNAAQQESHTPFSIIKADGQWHVALIPLDSFLEAVGGQPIGKQIQDISVGLNSDTQSNHLEVSDLYLLGK